MTKSQKQAIISDYINGKSIKQIAEEQGYCAEYIRVIAKGKLGGKEL